VTSPRILVVEDDDGIAELLALNLGQEGMAVERCRDAEAALRALGREEPDAILLDLGLPGADGLDLCRAVRRRSRTPILIVTSRREEEDKVRGLELGADDYVTKPFGVRELVARVKALLRRADPESPKSRVFGPLEIDTERKTVVLQGRAVDLTAMEYRILELLSGAPGRVFSRAQILDGLKDDLDAPFERTIDSHLARLRRKLGDDAREPRFVDTVRGLGYRFKA
jgi:DNA-binding response OmpR family regulator